VAKVLLGLLAAVLVVIAAARFAYSVSTDPGEEPVNEAWAQDKMEFVTWNSEKWSAWVHAGAFRQVPQNTDAWSRHSNASLAFTVSTCPEHAGTSHIPSSRCQTGDHLRIR